MKAHSIPCSRFCFVALAVIGLAGCVSTPAPRLEGPGEAQQAQRAEALGNFVEAANLWQQAAMITAGPNREVFRVRAADAWLRAGQPDQSSRLLAQVDESLLSGSNFSRFALLNAEMALDAADLARAEFYLDAAARSLSSNQQPRYDRLRQRSIRLRSDPAGFAISAAASALRSMNTYDTTSGVALLQLLEDLPSRYLAAYPESPGMGGGLDGWPQLAVIIRQALVSGADLEPLAQSWAEQHPGHVVTEAGFVELAHAYRGLFSLPARIGVLLPDEGGLARAGSAIRDGLVSSFLERGDPVSLRFYGTADQPDSAVSAYFAAINDGAEWIIGPLRRESVEALSGLGSLGVPFLMLNSPPERERQLQENLVYSLSLSQELEARAIARRALASGLHSAIALTADNTWGQRVNAAFSEAFIAGGGEVTASVAFDPGASDHGELLTQLLKIDESQDRKNRLQATLGISLSFEPTRRDDFDLIFLAAEPSQGRQIRPQLRFYDAGSKPVFAMGRIFGGAVRPELDLDLNGIIFPTTRWHLSRHQEEPVLASVGDGSLASLYDLGVDAWRLIPWLPLMRKDPDLRVPGEVGMLSMEPSGRIDREPVWAVFSAGAPVPAAFDSE